MMKKQGFTLAEVLITLGIIGVIAALTAPVLVKNSGTAKVGPALAKAVNTLEIANQNLLTENELTRITAVPDYTSALPEFMNVSYLGTNDYTAFSTNTVSDYSGAGFASLFLLPKNKTTFIPCAYAGITAGLGGKGLGDNIGESGLGENVEVQAGTSVLDQGLQESVGTIGSDNDGEQGDTQVDGTPNITPGYQWDNNVNNPETIRNNTTYATAITNGYKFMMKDGTIYSIYIWPTAGMTYSKPSNEMIGYVNIDINGVNAGPNRYGKDVFAFPYIDHATSQYANVYKIGTFFSGGVGCHSNDIYSYYTDLIRKNGWKIPDNYPIKKW